jgi:glutamate 5-kinase
MVRHHQNGHQNGHGSDGNNSDSEGHRRPTVVIKVGTSSLINAEHSTLNLRALAGLAETVRTLRDNGYNVVLVTSGAVGAGCQRMNLESKPKELARKQALAAIGQVHLMRFYDDLFSAVGLVSELQRHSFG